MRNIKSKITILKKHKNKVANKNNNTNLSNNDDIIDNNCNNNNSINSNKEELFKFIRSGRIVDEYGIQIDCEEFIKMALEWCQDGWDTQTYYEQNPTTNYIDYSKYHDTYVDGLRVSSSTDFC